MPCSRRFLAAAAASLAAAAFLLGSATAQDKVIQSANIKLE